MNDLSDAPAWLLGVDSGGTFTDFVLFADGEMRVHKVLSTPAAPERAILTGLRELGIPEARLDGGLLVVHGSTVATNAALEGKGAPTLYVGNRGFADLLTIGRQTRSELYALSPPARPVPVTAERCVEIGGRVDARGVLLEELSDDDIERVRAAARAAGVEAIAINLLFSFLNDGPEKRLADALGDEWFVVHSAEVLREYREYERGIATWLCAWLGPLVGRYLARLQSGLGSTPLAIMQSSGGTMDARAAEKRAVNLLLSGPAGGLIGASRLGERIGRPQLLSFDMGGTSTDVALLDGAPRLTGEGRIGPWPVAVPMVDMHTIGAGGGSIARVDTGGMLLVGPESAGADPGPACYGRGGEAATVTDANLVLGRLPAEQRLAGSLALDLGAARRAVGAVAGRLGLGIEEAAEGIVRIANEHMAAALRLISVQRGFDLEGFVLCSFGGAGGLHVCELAQALGLREALVPVQAGVLSALGLVLAPRQRQLSRSIIEPLDGIAPGRLVAMADALAAQGEAALRAEGVPPGLIERRDSLDLRYVGQTHTLNVAGLDPGQAATAFAAQHRRRYGHELQRGIEVVNVRVEVSAELHRPELPELPAGAGSKEGPVLRREDLAVDSDRAGPVVVLDASSTTWVARGWTVRRDRWGNLRLQRSIGP
jgi:N-methylhydantoinase A